MKFEEETQSCVENYLKEKGLPIDLAVTFADVFIVDKVSRVEQRSSINDFSTDLAKNFRINMPIVSANMKDVTESDMCIAMAREGGCGFFHQFGSIEWRAAEIARVKRADNEIIENPLTIHPDKNLSEAIRLMKKSHITSLLVVNEKEELIGIVTTRDFLFLEMLDKKFGLELFGKDFSQMTVGDVMTSDSLVIGKPGIKIEEAASLLQKNKIEKLPLVGNDNIVIGLITASDIIKRLRFQRASRDEKGRLIIGATVGYNNALSDAQQLVNAGADVLLLDTARASSYSTAKIVKELKEKFSKIPLVVGNVDNPEGTMLLISNGADAVKVGIGPGSACKTRMETGVGVPQVSAIAECAAVAQNYGVPIIADGGIRHGRDMNISLVAGASCVMLGSVLAGTDEAPGKLFVDNSQRFKIYRGSASIDAQVNRVEVGDLDKVRAPEGESRRITYKGDVISVIENWVAHLRSGMSYLDAFTIKDLYSCKFRRQSPAAFQEGMPQV